MQYAMVIGSIVITLELQLSNLADLRSRQQILIYKICNNLEKIVISVPFFESRPWHEETECYKM